MKDSTLAAIIATTIITAVALLCAAMFYSTRITTHIDKEMNIVCYSNGTEMKCFLYHDEGTHLQIEPQKDLGT